MAVIFEWRGDFTNQEVNALHAEAFRTRVFDESEWDWAERVRRHSLGWVVARDGADLAGFVNVLWDGLVHAWLQTPWSPGRRAAAALAPGWSSMPGTAPERPAVSTCTWISKITWRRSTTGRAGLRRSAPGYCGSHRTTTAGRGPDCCWWLISHGSPPPRLSRDAGHIAGLGGVIQVTATGS